MESHDTDLVLCVSPPAAATSTTLMAHIPIVARVHRIPLFVFSSSSRDGAAVLARALGLRSVCCAALKRSSVEQLNSWKERVIEHIHHIIPDSCVPWLQKGGLRLQLLPTKVLLVRRKRPEGAKHVLHKKKKQKHTKK